MRDVWAGESESLPSKAVHDEPSRALPNPIPQVNLVEQNLRNELRRQKGRRPHAQLLVSLEASPRQIEAAYALARRQFDPRAFRPFGAEAVALALEILDLLTAARDQLLATRARSASSPSWWERLRAKRGMT